MLYTTFTGMNNNKIIPEREREREREKRECVCVEKLIIG